MLASFARYSSRARDTSRMSGLSVSFSTAGGRVCSIGWKGIGPIPFRTGEFFTRTDRIHVSPRIAREICARTCVRASHMRDTRLDARIDREERVLWYYGWWRERGIVGRTRGDLKRSSYLWLLLLSSVFQSRGEFVLIKWE